MDGEGAINFKAYFDYADAMRGVDDLTNKFEAAGMKLQDAFDFGRAFDGNKQELKKFIGDLESTLASVKQQIKDATAGVAGDKSLQKSLEEQLKAAEATKKQADEIYGDAQRKMWREQKKAYGDVARLLDEEEEKLAKIKAQYDEMTEAFKTQDPSTIEQDSLDYYNELAKAIQEAASSVDNLREQYDEAVGEFGRKEAGKGDSFITKALEDAKKASDEVDRLKKELAELQSGVAGSGTTDKDLENLKKQAEQLDATLKGAKARLKDPDMETGNIFNGLTQGVQGLMGAYTAASGVLAQFGADEKDLQKVQTQLQGSMSLLMGVQQVYNALQMESAFRTQVLDKVMISLSKTYQKVAASSALTKLGVAGLVAAVIAGIAALMIHISKFQKKQEDMNKVAKNTASGVAEQIVAYRSLQRQWKEANGDLKKQNQILKDSKWEKLGMDIKGVNGAQKVLVDYSQTVIDALMAEAEAQALYGLAVEKAEKAAKKHYEAEQLRNKNKEGQYSFWDYLKGSFAAGPNASAQSINAMTGNLVEAKAQRKDEKAQDAENEMEEFLKLMEQRRAQARAGGLNVEDDEPLKNAGRRVADLLKDQARERERLEKDLEFDIRQKRIEAMKDSSARELSQLSLDHDKEMEALKRQREDRLKQLQDEQMARQKAANPNLKDYQLGSNIRELPKAEAERFAEQSRLLNEAFEEAKADLMEKYGSLEERRRRLSDKWQKDIEATTDADVKAILQKEARADIANFVYENVAELGTAQQVYDALKEKLAAEADMIKDDAMREIALASAEVQLAELKYKDAGSYRNYEKEVEATNAIYDAKIKEARARKDVAGAEVLEKERGEALRSLMKEYTAMYDLIFSSANTMTSNNLAKAIEYTQQAIKDSTGDAKELAELYERLRGFQNEQNARQTGWGFAGIGAGFRNILNAREWQSLADSRFVSEEDRKRYQQEANAAAEAGFEGLTKGTGEIASAFDAMGDAFDKFGGEVTEFERIMREFGKMMKELGKQAKGVGDFFNNLDSDFNVKDKGQVISQAIQGTLDLISMVGSQIAENKEAQKEWNRTLEESAHKLTMMEIDKLSYKQGNIFGVEDPFKKARDGANAYFKSMEEVSKLTDKLGGGKVQVDTKNGLSGENILKGIGAGAAAGAAVGTIVGGWAAGLGTIIGTAIGAVIGGVTAAFGAKKVLPVFETLEQHYEYLFDPKTYELNPELLADYDKLDEDTKQIVDNWDEIREKAEKAREELKSNLSEFVGDIGDKLRDSLVDAWSNRRLYASVDAFKNYVNDSIAEILEQQVFSAVFGNLFDQLGEAMEQSFIGDHPDYDITDDLNALFQKLPEYLGAYDQAMTQAQEQMEQMGYGGFLKRQENANASTSSYQQISETKGGVIAGGVTAIRIMMEQQKIAQVEAAIREQGIVQAAVDIKGLALLAVGHLESIAEYTSVLPSMKETVDMIERKTRNL